MKIVEQSAELLWITPRAEQEIERAGRTCYKSEDKITADSAGKFIRGIIKSGHESVIEHASASFRIITGRGITHEIVRHRIASYSQESSRYVCYAKEKHGSEISVVQPIGLTQEQFVLWEKGCLSDEETYLGLIKLGCSAQVARDNLPTCAKTEIVMTCNMREWRHFIKLRTSAAAHPQIRVIAGFIRDILKMHCPNIFHDFAFEEG